jgi:hypothetical protein
LSHKEISGAAPKFSVPQRHFSKFALSGKWPEFAGYLAIIQVIFGRLDQKAR